MDFPEVVSSRINMTLKDLLNDPDSFVRAHSRRPLVCSLRNRG
jgi:hypothetical protein